MKKCESLILIGLVIISIIAMVVSRLTYDPSATGSSWLDICVFGPALPPFIAVYVAKRLLGDSKWSFVGGWLAGAITLMMIVATGVILDYYDPESESCTELPNDLFVLSFMSLVLGGMISASDSLVMRMMRNWRHPFVAIPHLTIRLVGTATLTSLIVWVVFGVILRC